MAVPPERVTAPEADRVVKAPVFAAVLPIAGGLDRSNVPPKVKLPDVVTVPVKVKPLTVPVPLTDVTVPDPPPPVAAMVMPPALLVMVMFEPAVRVVRVKPVPLPISNAPLAGVVVKPVPPLATATVPVTLAALPAMLPDT